MNGNWTVHIALMISLVLGSLCLSWILCRFGLYLISSETSEQARLLSNCHKPCSGLMGRYQLVFRLHGGAELTCRVGRRVWQSFPSLEEENGERVQGILTHRGNRFRRFVFRTNLVQ